MQRAADFTQEPIAEMSNSRSAHLRHDFLLRRHLYPALDATNEPAVHRSEATMPTDETAHLSPDWNKQRIMDYQRVSGLS